jgi:hypothetical protein
LFQRFNVRTEIKLILILILIPHHTEWGFLAGWQALLAWALLAWPLFPIPLQVSPSMQLLPEEECGILNGGVARKQLPHALNPCRARDSSFSRKNAVLCMCIFFAPRRFHVYVCSASDRICLSRCIGQLLSCRNLLPASHPVSCPHMIKDPGWASAWEPRC